MKLKATKKEMRTTNPIKVSYCGLQFLLYYKAPFAYSSGTYGWDCDYYNVNGKIISMGYRPIGQHVDYKIIRKYEAIARELVHKNLGYEEKKQKLDLLIEKFLQEIKQ